MLISSKIYYVKKWYFLDLLMSIHCFDKLSKVLVVFAYIYGIKRDKYIATSVLK